ncbi:hypothetical protein BDY19DRAFT_957061 [Irpex rosettiformis]|uniref:Uncharacterized protein n=1 Tax=Irpex rosettiformis TaxID=378272 RepID=A0ACB8TZ17_9APHY|nr:hypothetical protein BDY19DRAFT_957061 [Irpex rosettiformis]
MAFTRFGKRVLSAYLLLLVLDIVVLALAARVNIWQEFFFMADLFPLGLSIATLVVFLVLYVEVARRSLPSFGCFSFSGSYRRYTSAFFRSL